MYPDDNRGENLRDFFVEILKRHFIYIITITSLSYGFLVLLFYPKELPSNILLELSPIDILYLFSGGIILIIGIVVLSVLPWLIVLQKIKPESKPDLSKSTKEWFCERLEMLKEVIKKLDNIRRLKFIGIHIVIFASLVYLVLYSTTSSMGKIIAITFIVLLLFILLTIEININGLLRRGLMTLFIFAGLIPLGLSEPIVKVSGFGDRAVCLLLDKKNGDLLKRFWGITIQELNDKYDYTFFPVYLVFQTREHIYLKKMGNHNQIIRLLARDNLLYTPESGGKECEPYSDEVLKELEKTFKRK